MNDKKKYVSPNVMNISGFGVVGSGFLGGGAIMGFCNRGTTPTTESCSGGHLPTNPPEDCSPSGFLPAYAQCNIGGTVGAGCTGGSFPDL